MSDIVIKHFEGRPVSFRADGGRLTMTMRDAGEFLQYKHPTKAIGHLYNEHRDEFDNDCTQISVSETRDGFPPQRERVFTIDGLILLCMFSEQVVAKKARHWLRKIGREVAITGQYQSPAVIQLLQDLARKVYELENRFAQTFIPAPMDNSFWPTPMQRLVHLVPARDIPKGYNRGGAFDIYASLRHAVVRGGLLSQRDRRAICKMPDYVIQPCPENDQFLRETFKAFLYEDRFKQPLLKLTPRRPTKEAQPERTAS